MAHSQSIAVRRTNTAVNDGTALAARQHQLKVALLFAMNKRE